MMRVSIKEFDIHLVSTFRTAHGASDSKRALIVDIDGGLGRRRRFVITVRMPQPSGIS